MDHEEDIDEVVRRAVHRIIVRLLPRHQKQFIVFASGEIGLITKAEADHLIAVLGLRNV